MSVHDWKKLQSEGGIFKTEWVAQPLDDSRKEDSGSTENDKKELIQTVYFQHLNSYVCIFHPPCLFFVSALPVSIQGVNEAGQDQEKQLMSFPLEKTSKKPFQIFSTWYPKEVREQELMSHVGKFTCGEMAEKNNYLFVGTEHGCLVVFSVSSPSFSKQSSVEFSFLVDQEEELCSDHVPEVILKPFLWSQVSSLIDFPSGESNETASMIQSLTVSSLICLESHCCVVAVMGSRYLAVLEFESSSGVTPIDVVNIPASVEKVVCVSSTYCIEDFWSLNIAVYGEETLFLLQATPSHVVLLTTLNLQNLGGDIRDVTLTNGGCLKDKCYLMRVTFSPFPYASSQVYLARILPTTNGQNILNFVMFDFFSHTLRTEYVILPDTVLGWAQKKRLNGAANVLCISDAAFTFHTSPHHQSSWASYQNFSFQDSYICLVTTHSIEVFSLPYLEKLKGIELVVDKKLFGNKDGLGTSNETTQEKLSGQLPWGDRSGQDLLRNSRAHLITMVPPQTSFQSSLKQIQTHTFSTFHLVSSLALFTFQSPNMGKVWQLYLTKTLRYTFPKKKETLRPSYLPESGATSQETVAQLKQQIEAEIQAAIQCPLSSETGLNGSTLLEKFKMLLHLDESSDSHNSSLHHSLTYIAEIAKITPLRSLEELTNYLSGVLKLLLAAEAASPLAFQGANRVSMSVEKTLHKLATYSLLLSFEASYDASLKDVEDQMALECLPSPNSAKIDATIISLSEGTQQECVNQDFSDTFEWLAWNRFSLSDITHLCYDFARSGEVVKLSIILNRHHHELDVDVRKRSEKILGILQTIPYKLDFCHLERFLGLWIQQSVIWQIRNVGEFLDWVASRSLALEVAWKNPLVPLQFLSCVFFDSLKSLFPEPSETLMSLETKLGDQDQTPRVSLPCHDVLASYSLGVLSGPSSPLFPKTFVSLCMFWSGSGSFWGDLSKTPFPIISDPASCDNKYHCSLYRVFRVYCLLLECAYIRLRHEVIVNFSALEKGEIGWVDVAFEFLNRVRLPELFQDEVQLHLKPFCEAHNLMMEEVLVSYIDHVINEIHEELLRLTESSLPIGVREREARVVALLNCLETDQSKAQCLLWLLHAWSPITSLASLESLGVISLLDALKKSRHLFGNSILQELQSAIVLRQLQELLSKYNLQTCISAYTNTNDAAVLIAYLACFISWGATSFMDALAVGLTAMSCFVFIQRILFRASRLLRPYIGSSMTPVDVAMLRLRTLISFSNREFFNPLLYSLRSKVIPCRKSSTDTILFCWAEYDVWEDSWKHDFLQDIKETVLAQLTCPQIVQLVRQFTLYTLSLLDYTADALGQFKTLDYYHSTRPNFLMIAAEAIVATGTALFLEQHVTTQCSPVNSVGSKSYVPSFSSFAYEKAPWAQSIRTGRCPNVQYIQSCERLRREFGVFVKPSHLTLHTRCINPQSFSFGIRDVTRNNSQKTLPRLMTYWCSTQHQASLEKTRSLFPSFSQRCMETFDQEKNTKNEFDSEANEKQTTPLENCNALEVIIPCIQGKPNGQIYGPTRCTSETRFTRLLRCGVLMGVGESYIRHRCIVKPSWYKNCGQGYSLFLEKLLQDIERNSSSQNAKDIFNIVRKVLHDWVDTCQDEQKRMDIFVSLSLMFHVGCRCLHTLPNTDLHDGIRFVSDVLTSLQLLVQSDLLDSVVDRISETQQKTKTVPHFSVTPDSPQKKMSVDIIKQFSHFATLFLPSFPKDTKIDPFEMSPFSVLPQSETLPTMTFLKQQRSTSSCKVFSSRFSHFSVLYRKEEALSDVLQFLVRRHPSVNEMFPVTTTDAKMTCDAVSVMVKRLFSLENYELALIFLLRFPEANVSYSRIKQAAMHLLSKVILCRDSFDFQLGVGLSLLLGRTEAWNQFLHIVPTLRDVSRVLFYSRLVIDVGFLMQTPVIVRNAFQIWVRAKWREQLDRFHCPYDAKRFQEVQETSQSFSNAYQRELLPDFIYASGFNLPLLRQFTLDFNIPETELFCCWLKLVFVHLPLIQSQNKLQAKHFRIERNPNVTPSESLSSCAKSSLPPLVSPESASFLHESYRQLMYPVLYVLPLEKVEEIFEKECLPHISPYDYETLELLLNFIKHKPSARAALSVLRHISSYRRVDEPSQEEVNNWGKPKCRALSSLEQKLQRQRLPFHALMESPWKVLGPLISDATLKVFMPLYCLKLRRDDFQMQLLWNLVEDIRETKGDIAGVLRGSRWTFPTTQCSRTTQGAFHRLFFPSKGLFSIEMKFIEMCDTCYSITPQRALAACLLILQKQNLLPLGQLQVAIAEWTAIKMSTTLVDRAPSEKLDKLFTVPLHQALPPFLTTELRQTLQTMGYPVDQHPFQPMDDTWTLRKTVEQAVRDAGALRSKWLLLECGLEIFVDLLPHCIVLCVHALYYYLAPILMRPSFVGLHNEKQLRVFVRLSQHPFLQEILQYGKTSQSSPHTAVDQLSTSRQPHDFPKSCATESSSQWRSLHTLVDMICLGCNVNPKMVRVLLLRRLIKTSFCSPLYILLLLTHNMSTYTAQDIIAMIGSNPSPEDLEKLKKVMYSIEQSPLTEGFRDEWFTPFQQCAVSCIGPRQPKFSLTFTQSHIETNALRYQYLIAQGMDTKTFIKVTLDIALKNERLHCTSSRALSLLYCVVTTQSIHSIYQESPEQIMEFWKHGLYLDAFHSLGMASEFGNFIKTDKLGLVRAFWRQSRSAALESLQVDELRHNIHVLILIASLCLDFDIHDSRLLGSILQRLLHAVGLYMMKKLHATLSPRGSVIRNDATELHQQRLKEQVTKRLGLVLCSLLRNLFDRGLLISLDTDLINSLDNFLVSPAADCLGLLTRLMSITSPHGTLPCPLINYTLVDCVPTLEWLFIVPALLNKSLVFYQHRVNEISLQYFNLAHYLTSIVLEAFIPTHVLCGLDSSLQKTFQPTNINAAVELSQHMDSSSHAYTAILHFLHSQSEAFFKSHFSSLTLLEKPLDFHRIFRGISASSMLTSSRDDDTSHDPSMKQKLTFLTVLIRFQLMCTTVGYQCLLGKLSPKQMQNHLKVVAQEYSGAVPLLILILFDASWRHQKMNLKILRFYAEMIVRSKHLSQFTSLLLSAIPKKTAQTYHDFLKHTAQQLEVSLHESLIPL